MNETIVKITAELGDVNTQKKAELNGTATLYNLISVVFLVNTY